MDSLPLLLLVSFLCVSIHFLISNLVTKKSPKSLKLPPGPKPLPIIGNILEFGNQPHQALAKLSKTYGPIMTMKLGNITTIVISSPQLAKEVLHKYDQIFSYRTIPDSVRALDHHKFSIVWLPPTTQWRSLRKFCATKVFSTQNLDSTQDLRRKKVRELLDFVKEKSEKREALDIGDVCFTTVLNSVSNTFFSMDLAHYTSHEKLQEFKEIIWGVMEEAGRPNVVDFFPIFRFLDPQGARTRMKIYFGKLLSFLDGLLEERLQSRKGLEMGSKDCKDVLDSAADILLADILLEGDSQITRSHLLNLFLDLFVAGIDTTSSTIEWAMAELLHNPKNIVKVREELGQVLGKGEQLEESHISKLPFLRAIVKETLRLHPPAPFLVPHRPENDVELCGYLVPKNAQILTNVWAMGRDSSVWKNPNEFMPERFLESEIDFKGQDFELIPFGAGRRICPGLALGFRSVHFVLASLLFEYDWKLPNKVNPEEMDMSEKYGITLHKAQPLQVIPISMHNNIK